MVRRRTLPQPEAILADLAELGVTDAPREAPDAFALQGLLDMAHYVVEHKKRVAFPEFTWSDPAFVATDAKVTLRFAYAEFALETETTLLANLDRLAPRTVLAVDARRARVPEFTIAHALYGEPTLFQWPSKPAEAADPRIDAAREKGWTPTLKTHNLLPGRGIVVLDEHQGLLMRDERFAGLLGLLVLFENGQTELWWNPFARDADADLQHWRAWGPGTGPASGWKEQFYVEPDG